METGYCNLDEEVAEFVDKLIEIVIKLNKSIKK